MKRKHYLLGSSLITLVFLLTSCAGSVKSYSKPDLHIEKGRLGILPFSSNIPEVGAVVSDTIGANLLASGFDIVDRTHMARLLEEKDISHLEVDSPDYKKIGDVTNVRFVLVGNIAFFKCNSTCSGCLHWRDLDNRNLPTEQNHRYCFRR